MPVYAIILAAGKGTRMKSTLPKVLQPLANIPLLEHVLNTTSKIDVEQVITIYGHGGEQVKKAFSDKNITWVEQLEQLGTGHAVQVALPVLPEQGFSLILYGDVPLVRAETLKKLIEVSEPSGIGMITLNVNNPTGYGRVIRKNGFIQAIVEHKDATEEQLKISEINTGIYCISNTKLHQWLPKLSNNNVQKEYYLTDVVEMAVTDGLEIASINPEFSFEVEGVNDRIQLATLEREWQLFQVQELMKQGVHLIDPHRFDLRGTLEVGQDVQIDVNVIIEGHCKIGNRVKIGAGCIIKNTKIADDTEIKPYSVLDDAILGENNRIGPFSRLRPSTVLSNNVHIGNFVEIKNTQIRQGSKVNHLAYIGDAEIGVQTNIGAGTITANYDGVNKYKTIIGDEVRIGSNTVLIAPVTVGNKATIGGGSAISKDCEAGKLSIARARQVTIENWLRPEKDK